MKKIFWFFKITLLPSFILFLLNIIFVVFFKQSVIFASFLFMLWILYYSVSLKNKKELIISIFSFTIIYFSISLSEKANIFFIFFYFYIFYITFFVLGFTSKNNKIYLIIPIVLLLIYNLFYYKNYRSYLIGYNSQNQQKLPDISFYDNKKNVIKFSDSLFRNKIIVLDFWNKYCGVCFKKFPDFEKTMIDYKTNSNVLFYTVNIPITNKSLRKINLDERIDYTNKKLHYKFKNLFVNSNIDSLKIKGVPTLLIIKNNKIYYKGILITEKDIYVHNIKKEIDRVINL